MRIERQDTPYSFSEMSEKEVRIIYQALHYYPFSKLESEADKSLLMNMCEKLRGILGIGWE